MEILPQASDLESLDVLLESIGLGVSDHARLADRLEADEPTIRRHVELADWLDLLGKQGRLLTEAGRRYVGVSGGRSAIIQKALNSRTLVERLRDRPNWSEAPVDEATELIRAHSTLTEKEARGRAEALVDLMDQTGLLGGEEAQFGPDEIGARLPDPDQLPVEILGAPSSLTSILDDLAVERVGGVLEISEADLRRTELEDYQLRAMRDLQRRARTFVDTDDDRAVQVGMRLVEFGIDLEDGWADVLVKFPTRAMSGFERAGFETLGEVLEAEARGDLTQLPGVGAGTAREVTHQLDLIARHGFDVYLYGHGGEPRTVSDLADRMLDSLGEEDRQILGMRFKEGRTFGEIGEHFDLTRQRIRQKTTDYLETLRDKYGEPAREIAGPLAEELDRGVGVVHRSRVRRLCGSDDLYRTLIVVLVLDEDAFIWNDHFISNVPSSTLEREAVSDLRRQLSDSRQLRISLEDGLERADEVGFHFGVEALRDFLRVIWDLEIDSRGSFENLWANKGDRIAHLLYEARRPLDLEAIAGRYEDEFGAEGEAPATSRRVQPFVKKHPSIYTVDNGEYVHPAALPVDAELISEVVDWCVERLKGEERAVSVNVLLEELGDTDMAVGDHLEGLNRYLLRDILLRHSGITGFHNTFNVAWEESFEFEGVTLLDRVDGQLKDFGGAVTAEEVVEGLPDDFDVNPHSVENYLIGEEFSIKIDEHTYVHRDNLGMSDDDVHQLLDAAATQLPEDGRVISTVQLAERLESRPELEEFLERDRAAEILWGLLRHDDRAQVGSRWLVAQPDEQYESLLERAIVDAITQLGPAYPREIDERLDIEFGYDVRDSRVYRHARELADRGELRRFPNGLYFPTGLSERETYEMLDERSEELRRAAQRADVERYPTDDLWLLARYLEHGDHLEDARRVLDVLVDKTGEEEADEAWLELRDTVDDKIRERKRRTA